MFRNKISYLIFTAAFAAGPAAADFNFDRNIPAAEIVDLSDAAVPPLPAVSAAYDSTGDYPVLKTRTVTFNTRYYLRVENGGISIKPNRERTGLDGKWEPLAIPAQARGDIREISADGDNLIAVSGSGRVFYMKFSTFKWQLDWGMPASAILYLPANRSWAIAHKGPEVGGYEDPDGKFMAISAGVTTLYSLSKDGRTLQYADPWLHPEFNYFINTPLRGRFTAEAMSASASTIFLIGKNGRMFTRLADFDSLGTDPLLKYSFEPCAKSDVIRLPSEDWREQPRINDRITAKITILQNGRGNAARELRVEGVDGEGNGGYYSKRIFGEAWTFVKTGAVVAGPFLEAGPEETAPSIDRDYALEYKRLPAGSRLLEFSPGNVAAIAIPGIETRLLFHTRGTVFPNRPGDPTVLYGTIELPLALMNSGDKAAVSLVKALRGRRFTEVNVRVDKDKAALTDNRLVPFLQSVADDVSEWIL